MSKQTSYTMYTRDILAGILDGMRTASVIRTGIAEGEIDFGLAVKKGTSDRQVLVGHTAGKVRGISERQVDREQSLRPGDGSVVYNVGEGVSVIEDGYVWVLNTAGAAVYGSKAVVSDTTGQIRATAAAAGWTTATNVEFKSTAASSEMVLVRVVSKL